MDVPGRLPVEAGSEFVTILNVSRMESLQFCAVSFEEVRQVVILFLVRKNPDRGGTAGRREVIPEVPDCWCVEKTFKAAERSARCDTRSSTDRAEE